MVIVGVSKNKKKNNMHRNKEDWCKDALNCGEYKQVVHLVLFVCWRFANKLSAHGHLLYWIVYPCRHAHARCKANWG